MKFLNDLKEKIIDGYKVRKEEALKLYDENLDNLLKVADEVRENLVGNKVDLCSIINGKSGKCSEDCKYCAQSAHYNTGINEYKLMDYEAILESALENQNEDVDRFSIVTSGRGLCGDDFNKILDFYTRLNKETSINLCASHGIIEKKALENLKKTGVKRYHHNVETSKNYYKDICVTHTYEDRIKTIEYAKEVGLEVCSGGIIGMGESREDRVDMAIELRELDVVSIPINVLMPIKGTPLESVNRLTEEEILKTIAIFRLVNPKAQIRLAAGRNYMKGFGERAFRGGANATITGNLLTTCGNKIKDDRELIKRLGLELNK